MKLRTPTVGLAIAVCIGLALPAAAAPAPHKANINSIKIPVCHRTANTEADLNLPLKATITHLLPSLTVPGTDHLDSIGLCSETSPLTPPDVDLRKFEVPVCHVADDGTKVQESLSIRQTLLTLFTQILDPTSSQADSLGICFTATEPPPPPPLPPPSDVPPPPGF